MNSKLRKFARKAAEYTIWNPTMRFGGYAYTFAVNHNNVPYLEKAGIAFLGFEIAAKATKDYFNKPKPKKVLRKAAKPIRLEKKYKTPTYLADQSPRAREAAPKSLGTQHAQTSEFLPVD